METQKTENLRSKLLLLIAPRSGGGGVEGIEGLGERKKGSPQPLIPISQLRSIILILVLSLYMQ